MTNSCKEEDVTDTQIEKLSIEAGEHGDLEQVALCQRALAGDAAARAECARVIVDARGRAASGTGGRYDY